MSSGLDKFTELQERILKVLIERPLHRDEIADRLEVKSSQVTRACNLLSNGTWEYVRQVEKNTWQLTAQGKALRFKSKMNNKNLKVLRSEGKISVTDEELNILSALAGFTSAQVKPCKAEIFAACHDTDETMRWGYYGTIDTLVDNGHIKEHRENYGSAVYWTRYSLTNPDILKSA